MHTWLLEDQIYDIISRMVQVFPPICFLPPRLQESKSSVSKPDASPDSEQIVLIFFFFTWYIIGYRVLNLQNMVQYLPFTGTYLQVTTLFSSFWKHS